MLLFREARGADPTAAGTTGESELEIITDSIGEPEWYDGVRQDANKGRGGQAKESMKPRLVRMGGDPDGD